MIQKWLDYLNNCKTLKGQTIKEWLDSMLKDPDIKFWFWLEHYALAKWMYVVGRYTLKSWKSYDLWPRERAYILENLRPDTLEFMQDFNNVKKWETFDLVKRLDHSKVCDDIKEELIRRLATKEVLNDF